MKTRFLAVIALVATAVSGVPVAAHAATLPGVVYGQVYHDHNNDSRYDAGDWLVPGAVVRVARLASSKPVRFTAIETIRADAHGNYNIGRVVKAGGTYDLMVVIGTRAYVTAVHVNVGQVLHANIKAP